jgi:hypothetical protein
MKSIVSESKKVLEFQEKLNARIVEAPSNFEWLT